MRFTHGFTYWSLKLFIVLVILYPSSGGDFIGFFAYCNMFMLSVFAISLAIKFGLGLHLRPNANFDEKVTIGILDSFAGAAFLSAIAVIPFLLFVRVNPLRLLNDDALMVLGAAAFLIGGAVLRGACFLAHRLRA